MDKGFASKLSHAFDTERLEVYSVTVETELNPLPRTQLLAYHRIEDRPMLVANMLLTGNWVDWIEVASEYRRQGYGRELMRGVEFEFGTLSVCSGSEDGRRFLESMGIEE